MLTHEENQLLCRVEGDAPMGQLMRRHWMPICLVEEVSEPGGKPAKARILGEDLVVFRNSEGRVGVMDEYCPHRRASLVMARNEDCVLTCLYHGWKFDVDGNIVDMPSEPAGSDFKNRIKHKAYPVKEWGGMIWAYMGPEETMPEFQPPAWAPNEDVRVSIAKVIIPCNWAQILEGAIDSAHSSSLHSSDMVPARVKGAEATDSLWLRPSTDKAPRLQVEETGYGFRYAAIRKPILKPTENDYIRTTVFVAPYTVLIPPNNLYNVANVNVPMDDTHTVFYFIGWGNPETTPSTQEWRQFLHQEVGVDLDEYYRPHRNWDNRYWQDREKMAEGNFTGISGIPNQDMAMWVTMGPITDRSNERLGASDVAIVQFRNQMVKAAQTFAETQEAIGTGEHRIPLNVCSYQQVLPKTIDWRDFDAKFVWATNTDEKTA